MTDTLLELYKSKVAALERVPDRIDGTALMIVMDSMRELEVDYPMHPKIHAAGVAALIRVKFNCLDPISIHTY